MESKRVLIYPDRGITFALSISNTPPIALTKIIQSTVFIEYPHEGIAFFFRFELFIFGGKERFCGWSARLKSLF